VRQHDVVGRRHDHEAPLDQSQDARDRVHHVALVADETDVLRVAALGQAGLDDLGAAVGRAIVDDDDIERLPGLRKQPGQRLVHELLVVETQQHNRY
jgi:hypothetical protein